MDIIFENKKLRDLCKEEKPSKKALREFGGPDGFKMLMQRLDEIHAFENLRQLMEYPPLHCKPLKHRVGEWAMRTNKQFRLHFEPANEPIPMLSQGGIDLEKVTKVRILEVTKHYD